MRVQPQTVVVPVALLVVLVAATWLFQRRLIYLPTQQLEPRLPGTEEVLLETEDGLRLAAWWTPARRRSEARAAPAVLVFHGNAGNWSHRGVLAELLADAGVSVLLVGYRGYGGNPGSPSEEGLQLDAKAALDHVLSRPDVDPSRLVYYGGSLGSGVATYLATVRAPAALVLRSPFPSMSDVGSFHYPFLPVRTLLRDRYASIERISQISLPLLVIVGETDRIVPPALSRKLYDAASEPKRWLLIEGAGHNDAVLLIGERVIEAIAELAGG